MEKEMKVKLYWSRPLSPIIHNAAFPNATAPVLSPTTTTTAAAATRHQQCQWSPMLTTMQADIGRCNSFGFRCRAMCFYLPLALKNNRWGKFCGRIMLLRRMSRSAISQKFILCGLKEIGPFLPISRIFFVPLTQI